MGTNINEVGGGPSTGLANDFVKFLQGGLNTGQFGGQSAGPKYSPSQQAAMDTFIRLTGRQPNAVQGGQTTPADAMGRANPTQSTEGIAGVINNTLAGQPPSTQYGADLSGLQGLAGQIQPFNFGSFNPQLADFGSFQNPLNGFNATAQNINAPSSIFGNNQLQGFMNGLNSLGTQDQNSMLNLSRTFGNATALGAAPNVSLDAPDISPYIAQLERENAKSLGDVRARFGAQGGAAFGTPAAFAEANLTAEQSARNAATLADIGRAQQGMGLQRDALNSQNYNQYAGNNLQAQLSNQGLNANMFSNLLGNQTQALQAGGNLALNALGQDAGNQLTAGVNNAANNLQAQGLNLNALTNQGNLNLDQLRGQSTQGIQAQGLQNDFQNMQANNQLNAQTLMGNLMNMINQTNLQGQGMNQQQNQFNTSTQQNLLQNIMAMFQNMSMPGIAQRQNIATPSAGANILNGAVGLAGAAAPFLNPGLSQVQPSGGIPQLYGSPSLNALPPIQAMPNYTVPQPRRI